MCGLLLTALQLFIGTHFEATLFVPSGANIDCPKAFGQGINNLMALVFLLLLLPLTLGLGLVRLVPRLERRLPEPVAYTSGAPPTAHIWRRLPPETAATVKT